MSRTSKYLSVQAVAPVANIWQAGLYIRLSREDGDKPESESVASQKAILQRFISDNPEINLTDF